MEWRAPITRALIVLLSIIPLTANAQTVTYIHTDALGSVVATSDEAGNVTHTREYEPYGYQLGGLTEGVGYTGHVQDSTTGLVYMQQRYYDPALGRFLSVDPVSASSSTGANFNRYWYADNNPYRYVDPDGRRSTVVGNNIQIEPEDRTVPSVTIANTVGASGVNPSQRHFHQYDVRTPSSLSSQQASAGLNRSPTPGNDQPASPQGTRNNAGYIPPLPGANMVKSFSVPSPDPSKFTDITVNYTISGEHKLSEGFVIRFGEIGEAGDVTLRSYGEGNNWRQSPAIEGVWKPQVERVWQNNHREIEQGR